MGCDIHSFVEVKIDDKWIKTVGYFPNSLDGESPFDWRCYGIFGFLADVRNYSRVPTIAEPRGLPKDSLFLYPPEAIVKTEVFSFDDPYFWGDGLHSCSWLTLKELLNFDYDQVFEDLRVTRQTSPNVWNGGCTGKPGEGEKTTVRDFLGEAFFADLAILETLGTPDNVRIVFGFDN